MIRIIVLVRTSVVFTSAARRIPCRNATAAVGRVGSPLSLATVHVTNVVGVLLVKLFSSQVRKLALKERQSIFHGQASTLSNNAKQKVNECCSKEISVC